LIITRPTVHHVDVFATGPLTGNGLGVFLDTEYWPAAAMQRLTREMRQFESVFLSEVEARGATARVFTVDEELPFAGHPVLGAAAVLHRTRAASIESCSWTLKLPHGHISVKTRNLGNCYRCEMDQGLPLFGGAVAAAALHPILSSLGLNVADMVAGLTAQVVSTGLPYLIVPLRPEALARAAISGLALEALLATVGAKFVLLLDVDGREMRTWDNLGQVEDVATGSAAGPAAAYLCSVGLVQAAVPIDLAQGRFAGRPSRIAVVQDPAGRLLVSGEVWPVSHGVLDFDPRAIEP